MKTFLTKPWLKALSGLCVNLSAGWFGAALITFNFLDPSKKGGFWVLTYDIVFGTLFLLLTVRVEKYLEEL
ncbi:MAG: hypothetical protein FJ044_00970 [Candidatus Cloacimonetes bacterium]|nr:hypothetical protein [Candidatus Cloacimonadota bacterium]